MIADPGVESSIPALPQTFGEIDHEIISTVILLPYSAYSRRAVVSYKHKYVQEVLVNCLVKLAQEKNVVSPDMTKAVAWDVVHRNKPKKTREL